MNLANRFLQILGVSSNLHATLKEIGFPDDPERIQEIENQLNLIVTKNINKEELSKLCDFFESSTGRFWIENELKILKGIEEVVSANLAYAKGDLILTSLGLLEDKEPKIN